MSEFNGDDYDFAAGSIKGLRSWKADSQGRLRGVTIPAIWSPGENVAQCRRGQRTTYLLTLDESRTPRKPHHFDPACDCGFWAYDEYNFKPYGEAVIAGIIEGYGKTTIGTKGFRCEKARVVALCREGTDTDVSLSLWLRLKALYPAAEFFDDYDDMVTAHGAVLRSWDAVGEGFWDDPIRDYSRDDLAAMQMKALYAGGFTVSPGQITWNGVQS